MNIAHLFHYPGTGGAEKYALYLSGQAVQNGHQVYFVLGQPGPLAEELKTANHPQEFIDMPSWHSLRAAQNLKVSFDKQQIDIVHIHFLREHFLAVIAKLMGAKVKIIRTFHRLDQTPFWVRPFYWLFQLKTDSFIAVSEFLKKDMIWSGIKAKKIAVIYNGVPKVNCQSHKKAIGFLGRLSEEKGILKFIVKNQAYFQKSDGAPLLMAGTGPQETEIKELIADNKLPLVRTLGQVTDLVSFFEQISVLVLPSKTEALPLVILEAYSCGVPVVSFDLEPLAEVVAPENRAPKFNHPNLLEKAIKNIKIAPNQALIKIHQEKFTVEKMWQETEKIYKKA